MTNKEAIEMFKTISIVEILKLNKIVIDALEKADKYRCSECGFTKGFTDGHTAQYKYCPQCGRRICW